MKVKHVMVKPVVTAKADITIGSAIQSLYEKHVGSIVVTDEDGHCKGIFTERDAIRVIATNISQDILLEKAMTKNPITIRMEASFAEAKSLIVTHGIRHLPVINNNRELVGIVSIRNFLDEVIGITR